MRALTTILFALVLLVPVFSLQLEGTTPADCLGSGRGSRVDAGCKKKVPPTTAPPAMAEPTEVPIRPGTPMIWIRFGVYSGGTGEVGEACRSWPADQPIPANHFRATAEECGREGGPAPSRADVERMVHSLSATLRVPDPTIKLGPDPSVNEWNMAVVGLPIWLWTDAPRDASSTNTGSGMRIDLAAHLDKLTFTMGDGKQVTCTQWTPYAPARSGDPSPTCGHVYAKASLPKGEYTVNATAHWTARWSAMGYSGTIPLQSTASRSVPVGELQAVVVRDR